MLLRHNITNERRDEQIFGIFTCSWKDQVIFKISVGKLIKSEKETDHRWRIETLYSAVPLNKMCVTLFVYCLGAAPVNILYYYMKWPDVMMGALVGRYCLFHLLRAALRSTLTSSSRAKIRQQLFKTSLIGLIHYYGTTGECWQQRLSLCNNVILLY